MAGSFNPEEFRFKAVIDWVRLRVTLDSPSQFRHVQNRLLPIFGRLHVKSCDGNDSSLRFDITFQDPIGPDWIMDGLKSAANGDDHPLMESDVQIIGLELALDVYSCTNDPASLAVAALHMYVHHAHPPAGSARITKPKQFFVPATKREIFADVDAGYTLHNGDKNASHTCRYYVKRQDTIDGVPYAPLPLAKHRARFENTWRGDVTPPFKTMAEWREFRFESLSEQFSLVTATPAFGMSALLQRAKTQLGRSLDKTDQEIRHPHAIAKSQLPSYRRKRASYTQRDTLTNQKSRQALRNLTERSKKGSPRKFGGFSEQLTASLRGECLNNVQSPIYLTTDNTDQAPTNTSNTTNKLQSVTTDSLTPAIGSPIQRDTRHAALPTG